MASSAMSDSGREGSGGSAALDTRRGAVAGGGGGGMGSYGFAVPSRSAVLTAHIAFNEDLCKLLTEVCTLCGSSKRLAGLKTAPEKWRATLDGETAGLRRALEEAEREGGDCGTGDAAGDATATATAPLTASSDDAVHSFKSRGGGEVGGSSGTCAHVVQFEMSAVRLVEIAAYLETALFLAPAESARFRRIGRDIAHLLILRSLGVLHREVGAMVFGTALAAARDAASEAVQSQLESQHGVGVGGASVHSFGGSSEDLAGSVRHGPPAADLDATTTTTPTTNMSQEVAAATRAPGSPPQPPPPQLASLAEGECPSMSRGSDPAAAAAAAADSPSSPPSVAHLRRVVISDAIECIGDAFTCLAQYFPPSTCDDTTIRSIVRLSTETIKSIDRTLFLTQCALLQCTAQSIEVEWQSRCRQTAASTATASEREALSHSSSSGSVAVASRSTPFGIATEPTTAAANALIEEKGDELVELIGMVECMQLRTMHELCNGPINYLIAVVSVPHTAGSGSALTVKTQASTKAVLFQLMGMLLHQTLPQSRVAAAVGALWLRRTSILSVYSVCDPVLFTVLVSLSRHCGDRSDGDLLAVKLLTDALTNLAIDDPTSLRCLLHSGAYNKDLMVALLACCVSVHPSVISAGLSALRHVLLEGSFEVAQETGFIYCNCLMRLLESENTAPDNKVAIVRHLNDLVMATHRTSSPALEANFHSRCKYLVFELFWLFDLNVRMHHANVVQHIVSTLARIVRCAGPSDFSLNPPTATAAVATLAAAAAASGASASLPLASSGGGDVASAAAVLNQMPQTVPAAALTVLVAMLETVVSSIADSDALNPEDHGDHSAEVQRVKRLREEKLWLQRTVDVVNLAPLKGIAKLLGVNVKELLWLPHAPPELSVVVSTPPRGRPCTPPPASQHDGSDSGQPTSASASPLAPPTPSLPTPVASASPTSAAAEEEPKPMIVNEYKDLPPTQPHVISRIDRIVDFLLHTPSLNPAAVGEFLTEPRALPLQCCKAFMSRLHFHGMSVTAALGEVLSVLQLPKEGQRIERLLEFFANAYFTANANHLGIAGSVLFPFKNVDSCFVVVVATVMLNTDLHNPRVSSKMTLQSFSAQLRGCNDGGNFPDGFAEAIFDSIARKPLSNVKGIGAAGGGGGTEGSGSGSSGGGGGSFLAPEGKIDLLFFSREERKELMFGIERQRIMSETKESIVRRSKQESTHDMPMVTQVARELFASIWPTVHVVLGSAIQQSHPSASNTSGSSSGSGGAASPGNVFAAPAVHAKCIKGLQCCLLASAAFGFSMEGEVTLNALVKVAQMGNGPLSEAAHRAILTVATSRYGKNLSESAWCVICGLLAGVARGVVPLHEEAEAVFQSISNLRRESAGSATAATFEKLVQAAFIACFTVPCNDCAALGPHLQVLRRILLPAAATSFRRSASSSMGSMATMLANGATGATPTGSHAPASFAGAVSPDEAAAVHRAFSGVVHRSVAKLCVIHQGSADCVQLALDFLVSVLAVLVGSHRFMMLHAAAPPPQRLPSTSRAASSTPANQRQSVCSALVEVYFVADSAMVQLKVVRSASALAKVLLPATGGAGRRGASPTDATAEAAEAAVGLLAALGDVFRVIGLALTAPSSRGELPAAGVLALTDFVGLAMRERLHELSVVLPGHIAHMLLHVAFAGAATSSVAGTGAQCVDHLEAILTTMVGFGAKFLQNNGALESKYNPLLSIDAAQRDDDPDLISCSSALDGSPLLSRSPPLTPFYGTTSRFASQLSPQPVASSTAPVEDAKPEMLPPPAAGAAMGPRVLATFGVTPPYVERDATGSRRCSGPAHAHGISESGATTPSESNQPHQEEDGDEEAAVAQPPVLLPLSSRLVVSAALERLVLLIAAEREHVRSAAVEALRRCIPSLSHSHLEQLSTFAADVILEASLERHHIPGTSGFALGATADPLQAAFRESFDAIRAMHDIFSTDSASDQGAAGAGGGSAGGPSTSSLSLRQQQPHIVCRKASRLHFVSSTFPQALALLTSDAILGASSGDVADESGSKDCPPSLAEIVITRCLVPLATARGAPGAVRVAGARLIPKLSNSPAVLRNLRAIDLLVDAVAIVVSALLFPVELLEHHQDPQRPPAGVPAVASTSSVAAIPSSCCFPVEAELESYWRLVDLYRPGVLHRRGASGQSKADEVLGEGSDAGGDGDAAAAAADAADATGPGESPPPPPVLPDTLASTPPPSAVAAAMAVKRRRSAPAVTMDAVCFASEHHLAELVSILSASLDPIAVCLPPLLRARDRAAAAATSAERQQRHSSSSEALGDMEVPADVLVDAFSVPPASVATVVLLLLSAANKCLALAACPKLLASAAFQHVAQRPGYVSFRQVLRNAINCALSCLFHLVAQHGQASASASVLQQLICDSCRFRGLQRQLFTFSRALFAQLAAQDHLPIHRSGSGGGGGGSRVSTPSPEGSVRGSPSAGSPPGIFPGASDTSGAADPRVGGASAGGVAHGADHGGNTTRTPPPHLSAPGPSVHHQLSQCIAFWVDTMAFYTAPLARLAAGGGPTPVTNPTATTTAASLPAGAAAVWAVARSGQLFSDVVSTLSPGAEPAIISAARRYLAIFQKLEMNGVSALALVGPDGRATLGSEGRLRPQSVGVAGGSPERATAAASSARGGGERTGSADSPGEQGPALDGNPSFAGGMLGPRMVHV